jgi:hypothetical protein
LPPQKAAAGGFLLYLRAITCALVEFSACNRNFSFKEIPQPARSAGMQSPAACEFLSPVEKYVEDGVLAVRGVFFISYLPALPRF